MLLPPHPQSWLFLLAALLAGCSGPLTRYEFSQPKMGTTFRIVLYAPDAARAEAAAAAAFARIDELNAILSDYDRNSELSQLSQASQTGPTGPIAVSPDLWRVFSAAQQLAERTDGAFDVTVGPYVRLWRRQRRLGELPSEERLAEARAAVGYRKLELNERDRTVRLLARDMRLDLGGIAKGYTVDEVLALLKKMGIRHALVDGGGDVAVSDPPPGQPGWRIALQPMTESGESDGWLTVSNCAVATSGDTFNYTEINGTRYSHIIDPATGLGLTHRIGVTVIAPDGMMADAMASAISVLGVQRGLELAEATDAVAVRIVTADNGQVRVYESRRFEGLPVPTDRETVD